MFFWCFFVAKNCVVWNTTVIPLSQKLELQKTFCRRKLYFLSQIFCRRNFWSQQPLFQPIRHSSYIQPPVHSNIMQNIRYYQKMIPCRNYFSSGCRYGQSCNFSHVPYQYSFYAELEQTLNETNHLRFNIFYLRQFSKNVKYI